MDLNHHTKTEVLVVVEEVEVTINLVVMELLVKEMMELINHLEILIIHVLEEEVQVNLDMLLAQTIHNQVVVVMVYILLNFLTLANLVTLVGEAVEVEVMEIMLMLHLVD